MNPQTRKVTVKHGRTAKRFLVEDLDAWRPVAEHLASMIRPGAVVTLQGPLGAGKTTLVQYLARELGALKRATSPTFALIRVYQARSPEPGARHAGLRASGLELRRLVHVDAYRIEDERDLVALDLDEELLETGTAVLVEWPEKIPNWLAGKRPIEVRIDI